MDNTTMVIAQNPNATMQSTQYERLERPERSPPSAVFGPVRTVLYIGIAISYGYMAYRYVSHPRIPRRTSLFFILNLVANLSFTYVQFGLEAYAYAFALILCVLITCIGTIYWTWKEHRRVAIVQIPYTLWVSFASVLQYYVRILN